MVLKNDPTTLFTSAGMQPLVPYLKGEPHPLGKRLVNSQPSFRSQDIMEVGDNRHTTFFEMLGNWSLGDYFKKEQLSWFYEFLTKELGLLAEKLYVTIFNGDGPVPKDNGSAEIWKGLGIPKDRIFYYGADKNWWSMSGSPDKMPPGEIGGPDSEVFYDFGEHLHDKDEPCHPNCECGRFLEIGNSVFIQYAKKEEGTLEELPQKSVDFGGGLERLTAAVNNDPDIFKIDLFQPIIEKIEKVTEKDYDQETSSAMRVIADHIKAATFIIVADVLPSNKLHGYVLRRLLRRAAVKLHKLNCDIKVLANIAEPVLKMYDGMFGIEAEKHAGAVQDVIAEELERFSKSLDKGLKEFEKYVTIGEVGKPETRKRVLDPKSIFRLYETFGFPYELSKELGEEKGIQIPSYEEFEVELREHRELSRTASAGIFKGGLMEDTPQTRKLHTATHLLHAALRQVLGEHVKQMGSNITPERLRFDFSHPKPLSGLEIERISELVNQKIEEDLAVTWKEMALEQALKEGALAFFGEKYGQRVKVYTIGDPSARLPDGQASSGPPFSREVCGGPHVEHTGEIGHVTITKEEGVGTGVRRIYAELR